MEKCEFPVKFVQITELQNYRITDTFTYYRIAELQDIQIPTDDCPHLDP
ncbi:10207_t:CDS:2 [Entrophospora sp. SA101]|nr:10207_t:CDS:2 [Entrophospora sp. SA101]